jgi:hypothetical protein
MHSQGKLAKDIGATLIELEALQRKLDYQIGTIKAFKKMLEKGQVEHTKILGKNVFIEEVWKITYVNLEMWM